MAEVVNSALSVEVDRDPWVGTATELLRALIRLQTVNPPGREEVAALRLARFADESGMRAEVIPVAPGRAHVLLEVRGARPDLAPVVAVAHSDVVRAGRGWTRPPFGAVVEDGYVWGRGAIDAKGVAAVWATVLARFASCGALPRTLRLIVAAGEEHPRGALADLLEERPDLARAHAAIGEGGGYVRGHGASWFTTVGTAECGRVRVPHDARRPSIVTPPRAPAFLVQHLEALSRGQKSAAPRLDALIETFPAGVDVREASFARWTRGVAEAFAVADDAVAAMTVARPLPRTAWSRSTATEYTVPPQAPPPEGATSVWPATCSGTDVPAHGAIAHALRHERVPGIGPTCALPMLTRGRTDLAWFRTRGVPSYGFFPLDPADRPEDVHGPDERLSLVGIRRGLRLLEGVARTLAAAPDAGTTS